MRTELDDLWPQRREVVAALSAAAAEGDRSENAEYIYRKKQLREMDRRIRYLQKRLDVLKPVVRAAGPADRAFFGARVEVEDDQGEKRRFRIVGADEIDLHVDGISVDSPVAKALLGRSVDETVSVQVPEGRRQFTILGVCFPGDE